MPNEKRTRRDTPYKRTTLPLSEAYRKMPLSLSFDADLALAYIGRFLVRAGAARPTASAITRAALLSWAARLDAAEADAVYREVMRASAATSPTGEDQRLAELRLFAVPIGGVLPAWDLIRRGQRAIRESLEMLERVEALTELSCGNGGAAA